MTKIQSVSRNELLLHVTGFDRACHKCANSTFTPLDIPRITLFLFVYGLGTQSFCEFTCELFQAGPLPSKVPSFIPHADWVTAVCQKSAALLWPQL